MFQSEVQYNLHVPLKPLLIELTVLLLKIESFHVMWLVSLIFAALTVFSGDSIASQLARKTGKIIYDIESRGARRQLSPEVGSCYWQQSGILG